MFHHILVPLDGSVRAERALPVAAQIARAAGGSLLLVRVVSSPIDYSGGLSPVPVMNEQIIESVMQVAADYLKATASQPSLAGIEIATEVLFGFPTQELSESARAHGSDLIVLCSHGRTGLTRWALGSVAHTLVHQSTVPVLVLRKAEALAPPQRGPAICTLVPLDGSALAEAALAPAQALTEALAAPGRGALHLVQVVKAFQSTAAEGFVDELNEEAFQLARSYLAAVARRVESEVTERTPEVTSAVVRAPDVVSALLDVAEQEGTGGCDLIAISTHGRGGLERWVMGSVTQRLLNASRLPVLVVRPQQRGMKGRA